MTGITNGLIGHTLMSGGLVLTETLHEPRMRLRLHDHERPNLNIVIDGYQDEEVGRVGFSCHSFSTLLKPAGARHSNRYGSRQTRCLIIEFTPRFIEGNDHVLALAEVRYDYSPGSRILARRIWSEFCRIDSAAPLIIEGSVLQLLGTQLRTQVSDPMPRWLERCRETLEGTLQHPPSISELAQQLGIDRSYLTKQFTRRYGIPPGIYVRHRRVERAGELLRNTEKPLSEIALDLGFYDQSHFSRAFAAEVGYPPLEFRRTYKQQKSKNNTSLQD